MCVITSICVSSGRNSVESFRHNNPFANVMHTETGNLSGEFGILLNYALKYLWNVKSNRMQLFLCSLCNGTIKSALYYGWVKMFLESNRLSSIYFSFLESNYPTNFGITDFRNFRQSISFLEWGGDPQDSEDGPQNFQKGP